MADSVLSDDIVIHNARLTVNIALQKKRALRQPIARFDMETRKAYMEHSDGSRTVAGQAIKRGRYGERRR